MLDEVRFGPFRLSMRARELSTADGPIPLGGRAFDILAALVERAGEIVSMAELMRLAWPGLTVEDNNVQVQISAVRRALGEHRGLIQTVPGRGYIFCGEPARMAPAAPARPPGPAGNLPVPSGALIGRAAELAELAQLVADGKLVTLTGPSGIGKTRLAIELGRQAQDAFPDGVWLVDLAPVADPALLVGTAATVLGVALSDRGDPLEALGLALAGRRLLLLIDNCEHLADAVAALVGALLRRAGGATILATSQETLRAPGERVYRLDPLAVPPASAEDIAGFGAVALFCERVAAADRRFALDRANAATVAQICRRLDGIPLALEMAAARVPLLGLEGLTARLDERLGILTSGRRSAAARYATLRDTVAWSYGLLEPADQALFRRLGILAGSFTLEAAIAVADAPEGEWATIDGLGRLVEHSLLTVDHQARPRYRLLETLRLYALERLDAEGKRDSAAERQADYYALLLDRGYAAWETTPDAEWLKLYAPELDQVRAALDWALVEPERGPLAVRLAGAAALLWDQLSLLAEGRRYVERARQRLEAGTRKEDAARLLRQVGVLWYAADRAGALAALEQAVGLYQEIGDPPNIAGVRAIIGGLHTYTGEHARAAEALAQARQVLAPGECPKMLFNALNNLGILAVVTGDMPAAREYFEEAVALAHTRDSPRREAQVLANLAEVEFSLGHVGRAVERGREAVRRLRELNRRAILGWALVNLAAYLIAAGETGDAAAVAGEALNLVQDEGGYVLRACLEQCALLAAIRADSISAGQLAGWVEAGYALAGETRQPTEQHVHDRLAVQLAGVLAKSRIAELSAEGAAWTEQAAISVGLALFGSPTRNSG